MQCLKATFHIHFIKTESSEHDIIKIIEKIEDDKVKKIILLYSAVFLIIGGSAYSWYKSQYKGDNYYVRIYDAYKPSEKEVYKKGKKVIQYTYTVQGFDEKGDSQTLKFSTFYKIKPYSYLEIFYNEENGSVDWVGRDRSEIPKNALEQLQ